MNSLVTPVIAAMVNDCIPVPFLQYRGQALLRVVCDLWASSPLHCKLLTLLQVVAWWQLAGFALSTDHPVDLLITDCVMAADKRDDSED